MINFSIVALSSEKIRVRKKIAELRLRLNLLTIKTSDYAEHHQHIINTYNQMIIIIDRAMLESEDI